MLTMNISILWGFILLITTITFSSPDPHSLEDGSDSIALLLTEKFLWGVATASYQIEGAVNEDGRSPSIWDVFSSYPGKVNNGDTGYIAADSYHRVKEDVELIKAMGVDSYRFSISWSRLIPNGRGHVNPIGLTYYNQLIDELLVNNIEPMVTLYHWDLPQVLEDEYSGWLSLNDIVRDFKYYADVAFSLFGDRVKMWITINEPWTVCYMGYVLGAHAPGRCSDRKKCKQGNSSIEGYQCGHSMLGK